MRNGKKDLSKVPRHPAIGLHDDIFDVFLQGVILEFQEQGDAAQAKLSGRVRRGLPE